MTFQKTDVDNQGAALNSKNWDRYIDDPEVPEFIRHHIGHVCETAAADPARFLRRSHVREAFRKNTVHGVVATVIWGYPKGRFPGGKGFRPLLLNAEYLAAELEHMRSAKCAALDACNRMGTIRGTGPSTYTKLLHFADVVCAEGPCLIYDQMVLRAISEATEPELKIISEKLPPCRTRRGFRQYPSSIQLNTYGAFLTAAVRLANKWGVTPEHIEHALFVRAPRGARTPFSSATEVTARTNVRTDTTHAD